MTYAINLFPKKASLLMLTPTTTVINRSTGFVVYGCNRPMRGLHFRASAVTRSCAYFSLTPQQLNQDVLLGSLEGTCFKGYDSPLVKKIKDCSSDGKCIEAWQCPCEGDFCKGGVKTVGGFALIVVLFSGVVL